MSKDVCQVIGVLIVKVWAVVPEVFLPHLSHQMSVLAECLLMASCQHFVKRHYLPLLWTGGPLLSCLWCGLTKSWDICWIWWVMPSLWPGWRSRCGMGRGERSSGDKPLLGGGCSLGGAEKIETLLCVPVVLDRKLAACCRIRVDWLPGWLGRQRESWVDIYSPLQWPLLQDAEFLWCVTVEWNWLEKLPKPLPPWWQLSNGLLLPW